MLDDLRTLPELTTLNCDICVIGAGAAGLSLAREFRNNAVNVGVLESGGIDIDPAYQALVEADVVGFPYRHHAARCRVLGGSTAR